MLNKGFNLTTNLPDLKNPSESVTQILGVFRSIGRSVSVSLSRILSRHNEAGEEGAVADTVGDMDSGVARRCRQQRGRRQCHTSGCVSYR